MLCPSAVDGGGVRCLLVCDFLKKFLKSVVLLFVLSYILVYCCCLLISLNRRSMSVYGDTIYNGSGARLQCITF